MRLSTLSRSVRGRRVLVTGAASGMGRATAHLFADEGAKVAVVDRTAEGVVAVTDEIRSAGGTAEGYVLDVSDLAAINATVAKAASGAADTIPLVTVTNLARALRDLDHRITLLSSGIHTPRTRESNRSHR